MYECKRLKISLQASFFEEASLFLPRIYSIFQIKILFFYHKSKTRQDNCTSDEIYCSDIWWSSNHHDSADHCHDNWHSFALHQLHDQKYGKKHRHSTHDHHTPLHQTRNDQMTCWEKHWDADTAQEHKLMSNGIGWWIFQGKKVGIDPAKHNSWYEFDDFHVCVIRLHQKLADDYNAVQVAKSTHLVTSDLFPNNGENHTAASVPTPCHRAQNTHQSQNAGLFQLIVIDLFR